MLAISWAYLVAIFVGALVVGGLIGDYLGRRYEDD